MTIGLASLPDQRGSGTSGCEVSIVVKALNEEDKIAACLESCLAAAAESGVSCEVVLADSLSTDRTVDIASQYPVRIVRFLHAEDRCCGAGVQLGYQHARGEFIYLVDGDMLVQPGFLPAALAELRRDPGLAGVAGLLVDVAVRNAFDRNRVEKGVSMQAREERWLNGGGVYKRAAIDAAGGYAADRNLKGWEEAELGMRVRSAGFRLKRIAVPAVKHDGHSQGTLRLLRSLWRGGRAAAGGVLLRQALGKPWFSDAARLLVQPLATLLWWSAGILSLALGLRFNAWVASYMWMTATALLFAGLVIRKRSVSAAATSIAIWHFLGIGLVVGLTRWRWSPEVRLPSVIVSPLAGESDPVHSKQ